MNITFGEASGYTSKSVPERSISIDGGTPIDFQPSISKGVRKEKPMLIDEIKKLVDTQYKTLTKNTPSASTIGQSDR